VATIAAFARPAAWPVALAGWLARGGVLAFVLPFIAIPTTTGAATILGPDIVSTALGRPSAALLIAGAALLAGTVGWLVFGGLVGAATDIALIRWLADDLDGWLVPPGAARSSVAASRRSGVTTLIRVAVVRAVAHVGLLGIGAWAAGRILSATYAEVVAPTDLAAPLAARVVAAVPDALTVVVITWLVGEAVGGLAARSVVLDGRSVPAALLAAGRDLVVHPLTSGATIVVGLAGLLALVVPALLAASAAWDGARTNLVGDGSLPVALAWTVVFCVTWLGGLVLAGLGATWRSALWTAEAVRHRAAEAPLPVTAATAVAGAPAQSQ
jgi:hypothetical protein